MAARRRGRASSRARRSSGRRPRNPGAAIRKEIEPGRDGKVRFECPNCGNAYAAEPDQLGIRMVCRNCKLQFTPKTALTRIRRGAQGNPIVKPLIFGVGSVLAVILVVVIGNALKSKPKRGPAPAQVERLTPKHAMFSALESFASAVATKNEISLMSSLDLPGYYNERLRGKGFAFGLLNKAKRAEIQKQVIEDLFEGDSGLVFRDFEPTDCEPVDLPKRKLKEFQFVATCSARTDKYRNIATIEVEVAHLDAVWRVRAWKVLDMPEPIVKKVKKKGWTPHKRIAKPKMTEEVIAGKKVRLYESELVALPHLESTAPDLRRKIDRSIDALMDPGSKVKVLRQAERDLMAAGKAAIPRLLNKFFETRGKSQDERNGLRLIVGVLRDLSGHGGFGYDPAAEGASLGANDKMRQAALKSWYAWWYRNHHRDDFPPKSDGGR